MFRTLLAKDLRRAWRNPVPWMISLALPFVITALVGSVFGPRSGGGGGGSPGRIDIAFVDEDNTGLTEFLKGSLEQMRTTDAREAPPFELRAQFLSREEAERRLVENQLAAAVILPAGFTDSLVGEIEARTTIELVKNPARALQPRIVEEVLGLLVTVLNAAKDLAGDQLAEFRALVESEDDDFLTIAARVGVVLVDLKERLDPVKTYLAPPLISHDEEKRADAPKDGAQTPRGIFAFLLAGMGAMFLLYMADHAMRDLYREARARTLERYQTLHGGLFTFIGGKVVFGVVSALIGATILFAGGAVIFQFTWERPAVLVALCVAYAFCAAGMMGLFTALAGAERRADVINNMLVMGLAVLGGCMFPPEIFPSFVRDHIMPWLPTNWFAVAVRESHYGAASNVWLPAAVKLIVLGLACMAVATLLFRRRLETGVRA